MLLILKVNGETAGEKKSIDKLRKLFLFPHKYYLNSDGFKTIAIFMIATLKNNSQVRLRLLQPDDEEKLAAYFAGLSRETRKRFGPHPFDMATVQQICANLEHDPIQRYVAETQDTKQIIAYMLVKNGVLPKDAERLRSCGIAATDQDCTFAPSIADAWQSSGLGSVMLAYIIAKTPSRRMILWGGVQASNERAVNYYCKFGFYKVGTFEDHNGGNYDMIREP